MKYYERLSPQRLVITGAPGAGKTVLAVELILGLLAARTSGQVVPVRISATSLTPRLQTAKAVEQWLRQHLIQAYKLPAAIARMLVEARLVIPVIDGLDEMDSGEEPAYDSRAGGVLHAVNAYQDQYARAKGAVVLTCRTAQYQALQELRVWAHDAARVEIAPVDRRRAREFLTARALVPARWEKVLTTIERAPRGPLAESLSTPWRLTLAVSVYDQRDPTDPAGRFKRHPDELITLATVPQEVRDHLLGLLIPAAVAFAPPPKGVTAELVHRWLATFARYLNANTDPHRPPVAGRAMSSTDLVLHELWPLAGYRPRRLTTAVLGIAWLACGPVMIASTNPPFPASLLANILLVLMALSSIVHNWRLTWPEPSRVHILHLRTSTGIRQLRSGLIFGALTALMLFIASTLAGMLVGVDTTSALDELPPLAMLVGLLLLVLGVVLVLGLPMGLMFGFLFGVQTSGTADLANPQDAIRGDLASSLLVGISLGLPAGLAGGFAADQGTIISGLAYGIAVCFSLGFAPKPAGWRYVALLLCTRRWNSVWLPWRLGRFLNWAYKAGLLRIAGISYQFRHKELQDYLATHPAPEPSHRV
ncbi:NACHT domain-containing protein [Microbispora sp. NBRC 16548]|uniref:NACHT domain-containing protein n=1 Tax=Microbispora sp. NBRC 16548 TaxID=3030994 RepID=UPI002553B020|nr:NACHT domain-containing protein [Microbispora sp. NBRC 16548]